MLDRAPDIIGLSSNRTVMVNISTPVYVADGNDVSIQCNVYSRMHPINVSWLRDGAPHGGENTSLIVIHDAKNGDVFSCKAENCAGFDIKNITINVSGK